MSETHRVPIGPSRAISGASLSLALFLTGACSGPSIDAKTDQSCLTSLAAVSKHASRGADSAKYADLMLSSVGQLAFSGLGEALSGLGSMFDEQAPSVKMPAPDSLLFQLALCDALNGMTAGQVIASRDSVPPRVKNAYQRRYAALQIRALQDARAQHLVVAESLAQFRIVSASLRQEEGFIGLEAKILLAVENGTTHPVRQAYFHSRVVSEGRAVPWIEGDFSYEIPGGLEAGEKASWRLSPNMFQGHWTSVRAPRDSKMLVDVVKLDGPDGKPLWGGTTFTAGDQRLLDSLQTLYGH